MTISITLRVVSLRLALPLILSVCVVGCGPLPERDRKENKKWELPVSPPDPLPGEKKADPSTIPVALPQYELVESNLPKGLGGFTIRATVSGELTETNLRALLEELHRLAEAERAKKGDRFERVVAIFLYTDRDRLEHDGSGWVARLFAEPGQETKKEVNQNLLAISRRQPEVKFGLTEAKRKEVFNELVWVEDWVVKQGFRNEDESMKQYKAALAAKHKITPTQLDDVRLEGLVAQWPLPDVKMGNWKPPTPILPSPKKPAEDPKDKAERAAAGKLAVAKWVHASNIYAKKVDLEEVRDILREVIEKYPGTKAAVEAEKLLKELR